MSDIWFIYNKSAYFCIALFIDVYLFKVHNALERIVVYIVVVLGDGVKSTSLMDTNIKRNVSLELLYAKFARIEFGAWVARATNASNVKLWCTSGVINLSHWNAMTSLVSSIMLMCRSLLII